MGTYVNIGNEAFASIRNGEYTDKSGLIDVGVIYFDMTDFSLRFSDTEDVCDPAGSEGGSVAGISRCEGGQGEG